MDGVVLTEAMYPLVRDGVAHCQSLPYTFRMAGLTTILMMIQGAKLGTIWSSRLRYIELHSALWIVIL